ncbi:Myb-like dna-binding protein [Globisporangium polare]
MNSPPKSPATTTTTTTTHTERGFWSEDEHAKFLEALKTHPNGPWKDIALLVGTRSARQVQTHAKKYFEKAARHVRGLRKDRRRVVRCEHRLDAQTMDLFKSTKSNTKPHAESQMGQLQSGLKAVSLTTLEDCGTPRSLMEEDNWVDWLGVDDDDHFDWLEALLQDDDEDSAMLTGASSSDALMDIDDSCLSYLLHILDTHDEQTSVN